MIIEKIQTEWRQIRKSPLLLTILLIVLGLVMLVRPRQSLGFVVRAVGAILLFEGGLHMYRSYQNPEKGSKAIFRTLDVVMGIAGLFVLLRPNSIIRLFPSVVGIVFLLWGALRLWVGHMDDDSAQKPPIYILALRGLPLLLGLFLFFFPFSAVDVAVRLCGAYLVFSQVSEGFFKQRFRLDGGIQRILSLFSEGSPFRDGTFDGFKTFTKNPDSFREFTKNPNFKKYTKNPDIDVVDKSYASPDDIVADYRVIDEDK